MAKELVGENSGYDPKGIYDCHAWEPLKGRPVDPNLVKNINGEPMAPAMVLRKSLNPNESGSQLGTPIANL